MKPDGLRNSTGFTKQMSFLPAEDFNPIFPSPNTLPGKLLRRLLAGETFDHPEFERVTGSWRLSAVVFTLVNTFGWPVSSWDVHAPTFDCPSRTISRYYLPASALGNIGGGYHDE